MAQDLAALYDAALAQLGQPAEIETPQLGRVSYPTPQNVAAALNLLRMEAALAAGMSTAGVITVGYCRGLGPMKGEWV
jgi:hypothetical protein